MKLNPKLETIGRITKVQETITKQYPITKFQYPNKKYIWLFEFGIWNLFVSCILVIGYSQCLAAENIANIPVEVSGDHVEYFDAEKKVVGKGNVVVRYKDIKMTCKQVTAYLDSKEAVAEGDVVVTRGDDVLKGEKITYNFEAETGAIINGAAKSDVWYGGGKEVRKISPNEIEIKDGYITTCDLDKPHYKIHSRQVRIYLGKRIVAKNVTFNVGGVPILYLPVYSQPMKEKFPKISFVPGRDKNWGTYLLSSYRYNLTDNVKGHVHLDYRQNKGFGEGLDYSFDSKAFGKGYVRTYYMDERDSAAHTEKERWRAQYRHKWQMRPDTTAIVEYHKMGDGSFIKDYFYREEFEREPQPESLIALIQAKRGYVASVLAEKRVNRFFTETERLPEAELNIKNQRLFDSLPFFYKGDFDIVNLNKKTANSDQDNNAIRLDGYNQVSLPVRLIDFLSIDPYVGTRQTFYTREDETDKERIRGALYSGIDFSTMFNRVYDYKTSALNLDIEGLRHIFTPNISYYYVARPTLEPSRLFEFDDIDKLDKKNGIGILFENKLQTKRLEKGAINTVELMRWIIETDYLLHLEEGKRLSNVLSDLELRPYAWLFIKQTALYDPKWDDFKSVNTDLVAHDEKDEWRLGIGHRYEENTSSQLTTEFQTRLGPKWKCRVFERYEFNGGAIKEQEYSITRDLHCWEAEVSYNIRDTHTFWLILRLKAFPELPLKLGTSYYRPKTGAGE